MPAATTTTTITTAALPATLPIAGGAVPTTGGAAWLAADPRNPFRAIHWRWDRAVAAGSVRGPGLSRRRDDRWVHRAARVYRALTACHHPDDRYAVAEADPDVYWALTLWQHRDDSFEQERLIPHGLEARILAREDPEEIARKLSLGPGVIAAYERLFFAVAEHLDAPDYIVHRVMGPSVHKGIRARQYDLLWKLLGYMGGPAAVDVLVTTCVHGPRRLEPGMAPAYIADAVKGDVQLKAWLAAKTVPVNEYTATAILDQWNKMVEIERASGVGGNAEQQLLGVQTMLNTLRFSVGRNQAPAAMAARPAALDAVHAYDGLGAELRGDEIVALGAGAAGPDRAALGLLAFPPPGAYAADADDAAAAPHAEPAAEAEPAA